MQGHQTVVYLREVGAAEINQIHFNCRPVDSIVQGKQKGFGIRVVVESGIDEIYPQSTNGLLLVFCIVFVEANVEDDLVGFFLRRCLKTDTDPTVSFESLAKIDGRNGVGKRKIAPVGGFLPGQAVFDQLVFVVDHLS